MNKPCTSCEVFKDERCGVLGRMQKTVPRTEERAELVDELLHKRQCRFAAYVRRMARLFINERDLAQVVESDDILSIVSAALWKHNILLESPTYEDFRRYLTRMIRNSVHREYGRLYGDYNCGECEYFLQQNRRMPGWCLHPNIRTASGELVRVEKKTDPSHVTHGENEEGCSFHSRTQFADIDDLSNLSEVDDENAADNIEDTLRHMESLGPRQQRQAEILRDLLDGKSMKEIAKRMGLNRYTVSEILWGSNEKENGVPFHQAGAYHVFWSIHFRAIFKLKQAEKSLWDVVTGRDFSSDKDLPNFNRIARDLCIGNHAALERYIAGWDWIRVPEKRGGNSVGGNDNQNEKEPSHALRCAAMMSNTMHPDFYALLSYAEDVLDREARKRIATHILVCMRCADELRQIEMVILPEVEEPISVMERLSLTALRLVRGGQDVQSIELKSTLIPVLGVRNHPLQVTEEALMEDVGADEGTDVLRKIVVTCEDDIHCFLTVLDEDELGEIYLFLSVLGEREGAVYCWPVEESAALPFIVSRTERHRYLVFLTEYEIPLPTGVGLDLKSNALERSEERRHFIATFFAALEGGKVSYRAAEVEVKL